MWGSTLACSSREEPDMGKMKIASPPPGRAGKLALSMVAYICAFFVPRHKLALEAAALRQQLAVFKRKPTHLRPHRIDRFFWAAIRQVYSACAEVFVAIILTSGYALKPFESIWVFANE